MAAVTKELIHQSLLAMQARLGTLEEGVREMHGEVAGMRGNLQAQQVQLNAVGIGVGDLRRVTGAIDSRLRRIERRLDIIDVPAT